MKNPPITVLGVELTKETYPILYDWAVKNKEGLEQRIKSDQQGNEDPEVVMIWLEHDLREQALR